MSEWYDKESTNCTSYIWTLESNDNY
jgi:hypothetical protein